MRAKIPQLGDALHSRFQVEHHGVMVAQPLAHIDTLDLALQNLTVRIELVLALRRVPGFVAAQLVGCRRQRSRAPEVPREARAPSWSAVTGQTRRNGPVPTRVRRAG
jgi:hypothetical protein